MLRLSWDNGDRTVLVNPELGGVTFGWNLLHTAQDELFAAIDWSTVEWELDGAAFTPDRGQTLAAQGIGHKSMLRFRTPGLNGLAGAAF